MNRTAFLASSASLLALSPGTAVAQSVPGGTRFVERAADFNRSAFVQAVDHGDMRMVWEQVAFHPAVFNNIKNAFNGLQFGFGYPAAQVRMAMANHGPSSAYGYTDYVWDKYKLADALKLKNAAGDAVTSNVYLKPVHTDRGVDPDADTSFFQDTSIETLQSRGLVMLTCHTAVEEQARTFVKGGFAPAGMTAADVANDILTHLIPGAIVVPSMVAAIAVLQQKHAYAFITPTFA